MGRTWIKVLKEWRELDGRLIRQWKWVAGQWVLVRDETQAKNNSEMDKAKKLKDELKDLNVAAIQPKKIGKYKREGVLDTKLKKKPARAARKKGVNACTKEPCVHKAKPTSKTVRGLPKKLREESQSSVVPRAPGPLWYLAEELRRLPEEVRRLQIPLAAAKFVAEFPLVRRMCLCCSLAFVSGSFAFLCIAFLWQVFLCSAQFEIKLSL